MRGIAAAAIGAALLPGCSMIPYYSQARAVVNTGLETGIEDRRAFNDKRLEVNLAALCDTSVGAVNRYPDAAIRGFINRLCGGEDDSVTMNALADLLRTLDHMKPSGS